MKYQHVQRIFRRPFYINFRNHYCPRCGERLGKTKVFKIVNSSSPEARDFDFHTLDNYMIGTVKFIWTEFLCSKCNLQIPIDEMMRIEKEQRDATNDK